MFKVRLLKNEDYETLLEWWKFWRFPAPKKEFLPNNGLGGVMITDENNCDICAGFLYFTNSKICWLEFIVSNPSYKHKNKRKEALNKVIKELSFIAKDKGFELVFTSLKNENLKKRFLDCGYVVGSENTNEMICVL